jgi:hypothetical protein
VPERAADAVKQSAAAGIDVATRLGDQGTPLGATVRHAFMGGFSNAMWVVTAVAVLFAVITLVGAPRLSEEPAGWSAGRATTSAS